MVSKRILSDQVRYSIEMRMNVIGLQKYIKNFLKLKRVPKMMVDSYGSKLYLITAQLNSLSHAYVSN